jgi:hypothetical protein
MFSRNDRSRSGISNDAKNMAADAASTKRKTLNRTVGDNIPMPGE